MARPHFPRPAAALLLAALPFLAGGCAAMSKADASTRHFERTLKQQEARKGAAPAETGLSREKNAVDLEDTGDRYLLHGNKTLAFLTYAKALRKDPESRSLRHKVGGLYLGRGLHEEAEETYLGLLDDDPRDARAHFGLGKAYFAQDLPEQSETHFRSALELDESLWEARNYLGILYNRQGRIDEALGEFTLAVTLRPDTGSLYNNMGISFLLDRQYGQAARSFEQAIRLGSTGRKTYNNLALALAKAGNYDASFRVFRDSGSVARAYNNVGYLLLLQERYEEAMEALEKAMEKSPNFYVRANANLERARYGVGNMQGAATEP